MPKYLVQVTLTAEGIRGTLEEGGTARRGVVEQVAQNAGAKVEAYYYAFGAHDAFVIFDAPDNVTMAAASTTLAASGVGKAETIALITAEEMDEVARGNRTAAYRPPGS